MKKVGLMAGLAALICACGGSDNNKGFTFSAPTTPTTEEDQTAVSSAVAKLSSSIQLQGGSADPADAVTMVASLTMGDFSGSGLRANLPEGKSSLATGSDSGVEFLNEGCLSLSVNASTITYDNCQIFFQGVEMTLDGSVTASANAVTWNFTMGADLPEESISIDATSSGNYTFTSSTLVGSSSTTMDATTTVGHVGLTIGESVNVTFDASGCDSLITGGTYELSNIFKPIPSGVPAEQADRFKDRAYRVTWQACGTALISHSL
jgi:hypothetical protein